MPLLIILVVLVILYTIIGILVHKFIFGKRFTLNPNTKTYTAEGLGLNKKEISFDVDGKQINGYIYKKDDYYRKDTLIIVCHGMWSTHLSYMQDIGYLCSEGYEVLSFDYTGTDISEGENLVGFGQSAKCLDKAIDYVQSLENYKERKIYVYGHSWGGYAVTNIVKFKPQIKGIIALAPAISLGGVLKGLLPKLLWPAIPVILLIDKIKTGKYGCLSAKRSLKEYKGKVFILHSVNDSMCKYKYTTEVLKKKYPNIDFYITNGKNHNPNYSISAISLMNEYFANLRKIPKEQLEDYMKNVDFLEMGELDEEVMSEIIKELE